MTKIVKFFYAILAICLCLGIYMNIVVLGQPLKLLSIAGDSYYFMVILLLMVVFLLLGGYLIKDRINKIKPRSINYFIFISLIFMILIQIFILNKFPASVDHDPIRIIQQAEVLNSKNNYWGGTNYFWTYPNNVFFTILISKWLKFFMIFDVGTRFAVNFLSLIILDLFIILFIMCAKKIARSQSAIVFTTLFIVFNPLMYTYGVQVLYSDVPILLIIIIILGILINWKDSGQLVKILYGILLIITVAIGQAIKGNLVVIAIAIIIIVGLGYFFNEKNVKILILPLMLILLGFSISAPIKNTVDKNAGFTTNSKYELPVMSWTWMGLNKNGSGSYIDSDILKMNSLKNLEQRKQFLRKDIKKRVENQGVAGNIHHVLLKIGAFLNVETLHTSYVNGYITAPKFYYTHQKRIHALNITVMKILYVMLYVVTFITCVRIIFNKNYEVNLLSDLSALIILGYIGFHSLFWEIESRYALPLFPLLLLINILQDTNKFMFKKRFEYLGYSLIACGMVLMIPAIKLNTDFKSADVITTQSAKLAPGIMSKQVILHKNKVIKQDILLKHDINGFAIYSANNKNLTGELVADGKKITLKSYGNAMVSNDLIPSGRYTIRIKNNSKMNQKIAIVKTQNYKLALYPIKVNNDIHKNWSLRFNAVNKSLNM